MSNDNHSRPLSRTHARELTTEEMASIAGSEVPPKTFPTTFIATIQQAKTDPTDE